jgi:hypothetical protein
LFGDRYKQRTFAIWEIQEAHFCIEFSDDTMQFNLSLRRGKETVCPKLFTEKKIGNSQQTLPWDSYAQVIRKHEANTRQQRKHPIS